MIAIIDYGMGNLRSVFAGFKRVGYNAVITRDPALLEEASHFVLPGVGAFKDCMENLERYGLIAPILKSIELGKPFLGICLGLQLLFEESEEFGRHKGLGVIKGKVVRFSFENLKSEIRTPNLKIPHMGWNSINIRQPHPVMEGVRDGSYLYFVHSYYVVPEEEDIIVTSTSYGTDFVSSIAFRNVFACQFHPEKSQKVGLRILKNFGGL